MDEPLTSRQAFEAMRLFRAQFNEREPQSRQETISMLLAWTHVEPDGATSDPAQWADWERAVAEARAGKSFTF